MLLFSVSYLVSKSSDVEMEWRRCPRLIRAILATQNFFPNNKNCQTTLAFKEKGSFLYNGFFHQTRKKRPFFSLFTSSNVFQQAFSTDFYVFASSGHDQSSKDILSLAFPVTNVKWICKYAHICKSSLLTRHYEKRPIWRRLNIKKATKQSGE